MERERRLSKQKTNPQKYLSDALPNNRHRNTTGKKYYLPPRKK